jgi:hypothetical protein
MNTQTINSKISSHKETFFMEKLNTTYFDKIRNQAIVAVQRLALSTLEDDELMQSLQRGRAIITSNDQADKYLKAFGLMHQAKLWSAFQATPDIHALSENDSIEIIDYGCGQGLGSIVILDYLLSLGKKPTIVSTKLVEPSQVCIKRAEANVKRSLVSSRQAPNTQVINKVLNEICQDEIRTEAESIKFHIFSNILDIDSVDIDLLARKICASQSGKNVFIVVSPNINRASNRRLDNFSEFFANNCKSCVISQRGGDIIKGNRPWTRYEHIFKATL